MEFPPFEHLHRYEEAETGSLNISLSNIEAFKLGQFRRSLPPNLRLDETEPMGPLTLRTLIARHHGVEPDNVLVTSGATEADFLVNAALVRPKDQVVVDSPIYPPLRDGPIGFGADVVSVPRSCSNGWSLDLGSFGREARNPRLLVFANLNNPTSTPLTKGELSEIAAFAAEHDAYVLVDETFRLAAFEGAPPSAVSFGPHMIATSTVTKFYGLGALRVGWIVATPSLLQRFRNVKDYTTVGGSTIGQILATWALERQDFFARRARRILDGNRKLVREALEKMPDLRGEVPDIGTVMFPHADVPVDKLASHLVKKHRTIIAPGRFFGISDHFRIGLGGDPGVLRRGLTNLRRALAEVA